jgi:glycosyltransferase involved in cell wall biosynthesis
MFFRNRSKPTLAISLVPTRSPWGGASPFVNQLAACMWRRGWRVVFDLRHEPDVVLVIDPRRDHPAKRFGLVELEQFRAAHPQVPILHRINECDQRKGTSDIDDLLRRTNALADHTVFISAWLRDYFIERWFDAGLSHSVIYNGADPRVYHPIGNHLPGPGETVRIVTHHWSDNWLKGYDVYQKLDELIASGDLPNVAFRVIGRWPKEIRWKATETFGPMTGPPLAEKLRECHLYLTASRWEPCGMHHVEGAQCGLPLVYHEAGGGIVEAGERYGVGFRDDVAEAIRKAISRLGDLRHQLLENMPSGERMVLDFADTIQRLAVESGRL